MRIAGSAGDETRQAYFEQRSVTCERDRRGGETDGYKYFDERAAPAITIGKHNSMDVLIMR